MNYWWIPICLFSVVLTAQNERSIMGPSQAETGPGGSEYVHDSVFFQNYAKKADGYWLFEPVDPKPDSAQVVVFIHGYGTYNPMIYGQWIRHLVQKGNIVVYPRYQKNLFFPRPKRFPKNVAKAIKDALSKLNEEGHVKPILEPFTLVGHSYGGMTALYLGIHYADFDLPQPKAIMACTPGTGPFLGLRKKDYREMPADTKLLLVVGERDRAVGEKFGRRAFETAVYTNQRNLVKQYQDKFGNPKIGAGHNESEAVDEAFDWGKKTFAGSRAKKKTKLDGVDYYCYWKLLDGLLDCVRSGDSCEFALGNTAEQRYMGVWSDGTPVQELEISTPKQTGISGAKQY